jgi:hypothetical protein
MAIISGIGVRDYYKKRGYELRGSYMMKNIEISMFPTICIITAIVIILWGIIYRICIMHKL